MININKEEKILLFSVIILFLVLLFGVFGFIYMYLHKEKNEVVDKNTKTEQSEYIEPLDKDEFSKTLAIVKERLRVFDVEQMQDDILKKIKLQIKYDDDKQTIKNKVEMVVDIELDSWKERVIRETLIQRYGEYLEEDYVYIDNKTNISKLKKFVVSFELEVLNEENLIS